MKKPVEARLTEKEIVRSIKRIDRDRKRMREAVSGKDSSDGSGFDLIVNAGEWEIKKLAPAVARFAEEWFGGKRDD